MNSRLFLFFYIHISKYIFRIYLEYINDLKNQSLYYQYLFMGTQFWVYLSMGQVQRCTPVELNKGVYLYN